MSFKISAKKLIYIQIIYNCVVKFLITDLHFPSVLNYVTDIINVLLLYLVLRKDGYHIKGEGRIPILFASTLLMVSTFSFLADFSSPFLYFWSLRNVYRFFCFFYCCMRTLDMEDISKIFRILEKLLILNAIICLFEYLVRGLQYDFLGGLFGNGTTGGNGPLNALMIVVCTYVIIEYVNKKKTIKEILIVMASCLFLAVICELKFFYFEIIAVMAFVMIFVTQSFKMLFLVLGGCIVGVISLHFYTILYPNNVGFLSLDFIKDYASSRSYGSATEINRLSAIQIIQDRYFTGNLKRIWFGLGMGNGETAQYPFLTSAFFRQCGARIKYNWFSHAFMYVESGYVGLTLYLGFFISVFMKAFLNRKENEWMQIAALIAMESIMFIVYNQTMRLETMGYTMFLLLSIPYVVYRCQKENA